MITQVQVLVLVLVLVRVMGPGLVQVLAEEQLGEVVPMVMQSTWYLLRTTKITLTHHQYHHPHPEEEVGGVGGEMHQITLQSTMERQVHQRMPKGTWWTASLQTVTIKHTLSTMPVLVLVRMGGLQSIRCR
jgi:hypothetical protein